MSKLVLYTLPICSQCQQTKTFLKLKNVPYEEKDLTKQDPIVLEEFKKQGFTTAPIVQTPDGTMWQGFHYNNLREYVKTLEEKQEQ